MHPISPAEDLLWASFGVGEPVDLREAEHRTVRGGLIVALLLGATSAQPGHIAALRLRGAEITGELDLSYAQLDCPLILDDCTFEQTPVLAWATTRMLCVNGAKLPGLDLSYARVGGDLSLRSAECGRLALTGTQVTGGIDLTGALLTGEPESLDGYELSAQELVLRPRTVIPGSIDLSYARLRRLIDDPATWPRRLVLNGLVYDSVDPALPVEDRVGWLARTDGYAAPPYEQLAGAYRRLGYEREVREVLISRERRHRAMRPVYLRGWSYLQDWTVGYGYRPLRALWWLAAAVLIGTAVFWFQHPGHAPSASPRLHFNPFVYSVDLLIPVINLGQRTGFQPTGWEQWVATSLVALGWILTTTIASGISRVVLSRK